MKIVLKKEIEFDGKKIKELELNLEEMTGKDLADTEGDFIAIGGNPAYGSTSLKFNQCLAARAIKQPIDIFNYLGLVDSNRIQMEIQSFLFDLER